MQILLDKVISEGIFPRNHLGIYSDDGLAVTTGSCPEVDKLRKSLISVFKNEGLGITVECNVKVTDYLDVVLDLSNGS